MDAGSNPVRSSNFKMAEIVYSSSYGFQITFDTKRDLTSSTSLRLRIRKPDGTNNDRVLDTSSISEPKSSGKVFYTVQQNDFPVPGMYKLQLFDETGGTQKIASDVVSLKVQASLDYVAS